MATRVDQIGRYRVTGELGRGAMGVVYRAEDPKIGRTVAIKTIKLGELTDPSERDRLRERLLREARSAGILSHPNIVTIYDIHEEDDMAYVFMEFVDGDTLDHLWNSFEAPGKDKILDILRQTAAGLDYAHGKGIVHRDIKPANLMVSQEGEAKITDFGVAKILSQQMTQAGTIMGTPNYMSPEQIQGQPVDGRSDQFSLAVIAFEMLTGEKPYTADSLPTLLYKIVKEDAVAPNRLNPTLDSEVDRVIAKAFSKEAEGRFATCTDFVNALIEAAARNPDWQPQGRGASSDMETVLSDSAVDAPTIAQVPEMPAETVLEQQAPVATPPVASEPATPVTAVPVTPTSAAERRREREEVAKQKSPVGRMVLLVLSAVLAVGAGIYGIQMLSGVPETGTTSQAESTPPQPVAPPPGEAVTADETSDTAPPADTGTTASAVAEPPQAETPAAPKPEPSGPPANTVSTAAVATPPPAAQPAAAAPPPAPVAPPPAPTPTWVQVRSNPPGATVRADNDSELVCTAPCELPLDNGRHVLSFALAGHRLAPRIINVPEDTDITMNLDRMSGTLAVTSNPSGATIALNGETRSEKTPAMLRLPVGTYKIQLTLEGRPAFNDSVEVKDQVITNIGVDW